MTESSIDHYRRLGVGRKASQAEIIRAYRLAAKALHPDIGGQPRENEEFIKVTEAYRVLKDPEKRKAYDDQLGGDRPAGRSASRSRARPAWRFVTVLLALVFLAAGAVLAVRPKLLALALEEGRQTYQHLLKSKNPTSGNASAEEAAVPKKPSFTEQIRQAINRPAQHTAEPSSGAAEGDKVITVPPYDARGETNAIPPATEPAKAGASALQGPQTTTATPGSAGDAAARTLEARQASEPQETAKAQMSPEEQQPSAQGKIEVGEIEVATGPKASEKILRLRPGGGHGESFTDCAKCPEMVIVPAGGSTRRLAMSGGKFGGPDRANARRRVMAKPFAVSKFKITYYNWIGCVESGFCPAAIRSLALATPTAPVRGLSWFDAKEYVKWLSLKTGRRYRLLTKAEWDYMARAGHAADGRAAKANLGELKVQPPDGRSFVSGASMSVANPWGIFEIDGRYVEWVEDCDRSSADLESELYEPYGPYEPYEPHGEAAYEPGAADPRASCPRRYVRGGPARTAATDKTSEPADSHDLIITLRVARDL